MRHLVSEKGVKRLLRPLAVVGIHVDFVRPLWSMEAELLGILILWHRSIITGCWDKHVHLEQQVHTSLDISTSNNPSLSSLVGEISSEVGTYLRGYIHLE